MKVHTLKQQVLRGEIVYSKEDSCYENTVLHFSPKVLRFIFLSLGISQITYEVLAKSLRFAFP